MVVSGVNDDDTEQTEFAHELLEPTLMAEVPPPNKLLFAVLLLLLLEERSADPPPPPPNRLARLLVPPPAPAFTPLSRIHGLTRAGAAASRR